MKALSLIMVLSLMIVFNVWMFVDTERKLSDCQFEVNHLESQVFYLRELNDYMPILEQLLMPLQLAELKVLSEQIRQKKHREHERVEQPLISEWKEKN